MRWMLGRFNKLIVTFTTMIAVIIPDQKIPWLSNPTMNEATVIFIHLTELSLPLSSIS